MNIQDKNIKFRIRMLDIEIETMFMKLEMYLNDRNKLNQIEKIKNDLIKKRSQSRYIFLNL